MAKDNKDQPTLAEVSKPAPLRTDAPGPNLAATGKAAKASVEELRAAIKNHTKCTGRFRLTQQHYRLGRMYEPGDVIDLIDDVPGKTWVPYEDPAPLAPPVIGNTGSAVEQDL